MLTSLQIDWLNSMCWQGGLSSFTTTGMLKWEMTSHVLFPCTIIGNTLNPCNVPLPLCTSVILEWLREHIELPAKLIDYFLRNNKSNIDQNQGQAHKIACSKGGQQCDAFGTVRFAVTTFPSFGQVFARHAACTGAAICDDVFIVAPPLTGLALAAASRILILTCPSSIASFRVIESTTTINVGKLDIVSNGLIDYQMLCFFQNTRLAFLEHDNPTPLISNILAEVDATILEALCRKGTTNANGE